MSTWATLYFLRDQPCNLPSFSMRLMKLSRDKQNLGRGHLQFAFCESLYLGGKLQKLRRRLYFLRQETRS